MKVRTSVITDAGVIVESLLFVYVPFISESLEFIIAVYLTALIRELIVKRFGKSFFELNNY